MTEFTEDLNTFCIAPVIMQNHNTDELPGRLQEKGSVEKNFQSRTDALSPDGRKDAFKGLSESGVPNYTGCGFCERKCQLHLFFHILPHIIN